MIIQKIKEAEKIITDGCDYFRIDGKWYERFGDNLELERHESDKMELEYINFKLLREVQSHIKRHYLIEKSRGMVVKNNNYKDKNIKDICHVMQSSHLSYPYWWVNIYYNIDDDKFNKFDYLRHGKTITVKP